MVAGRQCGVIRTKHLHSRASLRFRRCGASRSGYDNSDTPACNSSTVYDGQTLPSAACLIQRPIADPLERACSIHDTCLKWPSVLRNKPSSSCNILSNNYCGCDAALVAAFQVIDMGAVAFQFGGASAFASNLIDFFTKVVNCWQYRDGSSIRVCDRPHTDASVQAAKAISPLPGPSTTCSTARPVTIDCPDAGRSCGGFSTGGSTCSNGGTCNCCWCASPPALSIPPTSVSPEHDSVSRPLFSPHPCHAIYSFH